MTINNEESYCWIKNAVASANPRSIKDALLIMDKQMRERILLLERIFNNADSGSYCACAYCNNVFILALRDVIIPALLKGAEESKTEQIPTLNE